MTNKYLIFFFIVFISASCTNSESGGNAPDIETHLQPETYEEKDKLLPEELITKQIEITTPKPQKIWDLRAEMSREEFDSKKGAELEMLLIRPIYSKIFDLEEEDSLVIPQLTEGQKALYFFRKMDEAMSEGGIESLYQSNFSKYLYPASRSFSHINNEKLGVMAEKAAVDYKQLTSIPNPDRIKATDPFMKGFDEEYSKNHNEFYQKLENYIRQNPDEFIKFKN